MLAGLKICSSQSTTNSPGPDGRPHAAIACRRKYESTDDFVAGEKLGDFDRRRVRGVRTMHRVFTDRLRVQFADRSLGRLGRIGRAHDVAMFEHGTFALENLNDYRTRNHEIHQLAKERTRLVDR